LQRTGGLVSPSEWAGFHRPPAAELCVRPPPLGCQSRKEAASLSGVLRTGVPDGLRPSRTSGPLGTATPLRRRAGRSVQRGGGGGGGRTPEFSCRYGPRRRPNHGVAADRPRLLSNRGASVLQRGRQLNSGVRPKGM